MQRLNEKTQFSAFCFSR